MADELADFLWEIVEAGYRWGEFDEVNFAPEHTIIRVLTNATPVGVITTVKRYAPLHAFGGALYRTLALETPPTEHGIQQFANRYGLLGVHKTIKLPNGLGAGELLQSWVEEIIEMKRLVKMWDSACHGRIAELAARIRWDADNKRVSFQEETDPLGNCLRSYEDIASFYYRPDILQKMKPPDLIGPALWYIQRKINKKLEDHKVSARLLWDSRDRRGERLTVHIVPQSLIGCLWLQFAKAVEGNRNYRQCENCKLWFEVGGSRAARSDKRFCSPTCKAALHRKERQRSIAISVSGKTPM